MVNKIFITLGSQKFQFNRLLKAVDELCEKGTVDAEDVFAQIGYSDYLPKNFNYKSFGQRRVQQGNEQGGNSYNSWRYWRHYWGCKKGKKVIAVPRRAKYGEHVDDHQLQLVGQFKELQLICECDDAEKVGDALETVKKTTYKEYVSNTQRIISSIDGFVSNLD